MKTVSTDWTVPIAKESVVMFLTENTNIDIAVVALIQLCHSAAVANVWWHNERINSLDGSLISEPKERNFGECIALIHSEVSEAMEGGRKDLQDEHCPEFLSVEIELADALIRIFDLAGAANFRLGAALLAKINYNMIRPDHKAENREAEGGKQF